MTDRLEPKALDDFEFAARILALVAASPPQREQRPPWWRPLARRRAEREYVDDCDSWAESCMTAAEDLLEVEHALDLARQRDVLRSALERH